jgi:hypothetical protein
MQKTNNLLAQIHEDMPVYDRAGDKIGTVKTVQFGEKNLAPTETETSADQQPDVAGTVVTEGVVGAFSLDDQLPAELRERLERLGYIQIDFGVLASDRYASAEQIEKVAVDRVDLNATQSELIKG